jgi:hypothetical protein
LRVSASRRKKRRRRRRRRRRREREIKRIQSKDYLEDLSEINIYGNFIDNEE